MTYKVNLTFNDVNYAALVKYWGSETAWKTWVKEQTMAQMISKSLFPTDSLFPTTQLLAK